MDPIVGFDEFRWLQELTRTTQKAVMPAIIGTRLLARGLIEQKGSRFSLTAKGRIALAKLG